MSDMDKSDARNEAGAPDTKVAANPGDRLDQEANGPLLSARGLAFSYDGDRTVLDDVSVEIAPGEVLTLLGPNGAGKSTLLNCLVGALSPQRGEVVLAGRPVLAMAPREVARIVACVPQYSTTTYGYRVIDYVLMGRAPYKNVFQRPCDSDREIARSVIERMGIEHLAEAAYTQISGGERQLVNVCRALVQQPRAILFDEPTSALDYGNQLKVLRMVRLLGDERYAVIMTTHNPDHPMLLGGRVAILERNGHLSCGNVRDMMTQERLGALYDADLRVFRSAELDRDVCLAARL